MQDLAQSIYAEISKIHRESSLNADSAEKLYYLLGVYLFDTDLEKNNLPPEEDK